MPICLFVSCIVPYMGVLNILSNESKDLLSILFLSLGKVIVPLFKSTNEEKNIHMLYIKLLKQPDTTLWSRPSPLITLGD